MMGNHDERMFRYQYQHPFNVLFLRYKLTKNGFEIIKPFCKPAWALYTVNAIQEIYLQDYIMSSYRQKYNNYYYIQMMKEIYRLAKEHYPNVKFAILNYRNIKKCFIDEYDMKKELENIGYILIDTNEIIPWKKLSKQEFKTIDNAHPNGKAWDVLLPEMVIKLNIK